MASTEPTYTVSDYPSSRSKYPNPFFDLSRLFVPSKIKTLFKYCRAFFYKNEFISNVIHKLTEYPITDIILKHEDAEIKDKYRELLNHNLKIKTLLIEIGLDYHTYGNCFISANNKFTRYLVCPTCDHVEPIKNHRTVKFVGYKFRGTCSKCKTMIHEFKIDDRPLKTPNAIAFTRWPPEKIDIDYDPLTGDSTYNLNLDKTILLALEKGKRKAMENTPMVYIQALKQQRKIQLDPNNLYHFKRPTLADEDMAWGKPILLPALGTIWYMQHLRRGNEAIALEHIIPHRAVFPASQGAMDPYTQMNLGRWRSQVQDVLEKWKTDPNYIAVFPIPMGMQSMGGDAKALNVTPELKFLEESVINALGVPIEFVKGGSTWTGSSVSLRIVENHFLSYREHLLDFLNYFVLPHVSNFLGYPKVAAEFKKFKMSDDAETKQLAINLNQLGKLSDTRLLEDFGYDNEKDKILRIKDTEWAAELQKLISARQAEASGEAMKLQMRYQAEAEKIYMDMKSKLREDLFAEEIAAENAKIKTKSKDLIEKYTLEVMAMPPDVQMQTLDKMFVTMPTTATMVVLRMNDLMAGAPPPAESPQEDNTSVSDAKADVKKPAKSKSEHHTAPKKGNV
jgi:hypothetical protein